MQQLLLVSNYLSKASFERGFLCYNGIKSGDKMTLYNYKAFLDLDADTYDAWEPRFERMEEQALRTVKDLCPDFDTSVANDSVHSYCEEVVFLTLFGDELQTNLYNYHRDLITQMEQRFRYTRDWMRGKDEAS